MTNETTDGSAADAATNNGAADLPITPLTPENQAASSNGTPLDAQVPTPNEPNKSQSAATTSNEPKNNALSTVPSQRHQDKEIEISSAEEESEVDEHLQDYFVDTYLERGSVIKTSKLYKAYTARLRNTESSDKKGQDRAPAMVRGVVDYVRVLEERIQKLEAAEVKRIETEKTQTDEDKAANTQNGPPINESADLILETRFFHDKGEFDSSGKWADNKLKKGSYQCNIDPKYLIRVLYRWADGVAPVHLKDGEPPDADSIDILAFGVISEPISQFFGDRLGLKADKSNLIRVGKPFRPLIRNYRHLRDHLEELTRRFSVRTADVDTQGVASGERSENTMKDHTLPFPPAPQDEVEEVKAFETSEALLHFRHLFDFIDKYLAKPLQLYQRLQDGIEEKIAFENLWMLFDRGGKIYCPSHIGGSTSVLMSDSEYHVHKPQHVPQLFQIFGTTGGILKKAKLAPQQKTTEEEIFVNSSASDLVLTLNRSAKLRRDLGSNNFVIPALGRPKDRFTPLYVVCFHIDFDGVKYGTVRELFVFRPHDGLLEISSLQAYPIQYLKPEPGPQVGGSAEPEPAEYLLERGKKFIDVTVLAHLWYEGLTVGKSREELNSAVIIDFYLSFEEFKDNFPNGDDVIPKFGPLGNFWPSYSSFDSSLEGGAVLEWVTSTCDNPWCHLSECTDDTYHNFDLNSAGKLDSRIRGLLEDYEPRKMTPEQGLEEFKQFMEDNDLIGLLPGLVPGFALRSHKWVQLDLDGLRELQQGEDWDKLVLPPGHRDMVQAMVETHTKVSPESNRTDRSAQQAAEMDLVQGKGRGCIILLHGVPGVGKTSTAECVAAYTKRPLYPITCGDIGYVPDKVEENMEKHFKLAHKWGCVLLLDEADVFLAKRNKTDVKRNGLVSVFLRILEYYSGILFLTTNRVGAIDDAFRSRLHLTLFYPKLTPRQTRKIWKNNLARMEAINLNREANDQEPILFEKKKILKWQQVNWQTLQWNGRQIRNAFQTAMALAEFTAMHTNTMTSTRSGDKPEKGKRHKGPIMEVAHFMLIARATLEFSEYLLATHGTDEDELARREQVRSKSFESKIDLEKLEEPSSPSTSSNSSSSDTESAASDSSDSEQESQQEKKKRKRKKKKKDKRDKKTKKRSKTKRKDDEDSGSELDREAKKFKKNKKKNGKSKKEQESNESSDSSASEPRKKKEEEKKKKSSKGDKEEGKLKLVKE